MTELDVSKLEAGASLYKRHSRITFKIIDNQRGELTIQTVQDKSPAENYLTSTELIQRTKDLFSAFFKDYVIHVHPKAFEPSAVDVVDTVWIKAMMLDYGVGLKRLVKFTGIDKASLSAVINGHVNLSQPTKAMFFYFFNWYMTAPDGLRQNLRNTDTNILEDLN